MKAEHCKGYGRQRNVEWTLIRLSKSEVPQDLFCFYGQASWLRILSTEVYHRNIGSRSIA